MQCCVSFCNSSENESTIGGDGQKITFHRFPTDLHLRAAWLKALGRHDPPFPDPAVVCSQHFLNDDMYESENGSRQLHTGAIPSTVQVCMICLDTDNKLFLMNRHKLTEEYQHLTGNPPCDLGNLKQTLCVHCAQRLINFSRFRDKSLRARALLMDLVQQHQLITKQHINTINRTKYKLNSDMVSKTLGPDHCDLHIVEDNRKESDAIVHTVVVKTERDYEPMLVDEDMGDKKYQELNFEIELDPLKYETTPFQCTICYEEFVHEHAYVQHMNMHAQKDAAAGECGASLCKPHTAGSCSSLLTGNEPAAQPRSDDPQEPSDDPRPSGLLPHILVAPLSASLATDKESKVVETEEVIAPTSDRVLATNNGGHAHPGSKTFTCDICQNVYKRKSYLMVHMRTHTGDRPFSCTICEYKCVQKSSLRTHLRTHTGEKPFSCTLCDYKSARKFYLLNHMRNHTGEKPHSCELCEYKCSLKITLVNHMRTHTGEKPFSCNVCDYKCAVYSSLANHMRTHTGEKPFSCNLCDYKCAAHSSLMRHMRTHTGDKPFSCNLCEFKCAHNSNLLKHLRTHTGEKPFSCKLCEYKCSFNNILLKHMRTHTGEKPYSCTLCEYKSATKKKLVNHMKTHTGDRS